MSDFPSAVESFPTITNRHGLKMFVKLLMVPGAKHNVYLAHGFSDVHDTPHMQALTAAFTESGYNVILWDATHSWGRSEGSTEKASFYHHYEDLEDVILWSRGQPWFQERFALAGHSLGAMAAGTYAASHPAQITRLLLVAPVVSGPALKRRIPWPVRIWWKLKGELGRPGRDINRYGWEFMRSTWAYNLLASAHRLTMPVLIIGAGRDRLIPPRLVRRLFRAIPGDKKRIEILPRARHGFDESWERVRLEELVKEWLKS